MMMRWNLALPALLCLIGASMPATGTSQIRGGDRPRNESQRRETPPNWLPGSWNGRNDNTRSDVDLIVTDDGRATLTIRTGSKTETLRGWFREGKLDFDDVRYLIRQNGRDIELSKERSRDDRVVLRQRDRRPPRSTDLTIDEPKNSSRVRSGAVFLRGSSPYRNVHIELSRDRDRMQTSDVTADRDGRFEARFDLKPGHYDVRIRSEEGSRSAERRVIFDVGGMGKIHIDSPGAGDKLGSGTVTVSGTSEADDVEVEIYRGRERVFIEQVRVRNGQWISRPTLGWGTFVVTARSKENGVILGTDRRGFDVLGGGPVEPTNLLRIDRPSDRSRYRGSVDFEGSAGGSEVRIQINSGKSRVYNQLLGVRDGKFRVHVTLDKGHYDVTVMSEVRGRVLSTKRMSIDID